MAGRELWAIGSDDGRSDDLIDNYREPNAAGEVVWRVGVGDGQRWPLFHPSEADPDGGYRLHPYTIEFPIDGGPAVSYTLRVSYLVIAPRVADLQIEVNGVLGMAYLRPSPSTSGDIRLHAGLHTAIYSEGVAEVAIPGSLLQTGTNRLTLTARDGGEVLAVDRIEAIRRLDRMASGAGLIYQRISLSQAEQEDCPEPAIQIVPTVVYRTGPAGVLQEGCFLFLDLANGIDASRLTLVLSAKSGVRQVEFDLPATPFGHLRLPFDLADGEGPVGYTLGGRLGLVQVDLRGQFQRKRKWTVYVAPHVHTDIGYTHRQWEVAERLCRTIDAALDLLRGDGADPRPFAFHVDSTWSLETFLQTRDEARRHALFDQVKAGRFGIPATYVDPLTHIAGLEDLIRNGEFAHALLWPEGLRSDFATIVDVASLSGSLPVLYEGAGIRYLVHANNQDRGPFRLLGGLHRRSPYYWQGPTGGRVLVWLSRMYCELRKVCGSPPVPDAAARGLDIWLDEYESAGYIPDVVLMYGQEADNTDLDPQPVEFLRRWNEEFAFPRLVPSSVGDFFRDIEGRFGPMLPVVSGDGGAYWEDGAGAAMMATARIRHAQATLPAAETLESLAVMHSADGWVYPLGSFDEAWRQLLLSDEHTWGAFLSGPDPDALLVRDQQATKEQMIDGAATWADRLLHVAATRHGLSWNSDGREVVVYNPHSWSVSGPVTVEVAANERVYDPDTRVDLPQRRLKTTTSQMTVELWIDELPSLSYRRLPLRQIELPDPENSASDGTTERNVILENDAHRLLIDTYRGAVISWVDRALGRELVDQHASWGLGQFVYAAGGEGTRLISNRADLPDGDPQADASFALVASRLDCFAGGSTLSLTGRVLGGTLDVSWTLRDVTNRIEIRYAYNKERRLAKEAAYVAFPLDLLQARVTSDAQLGWVDWDRDSLPGACKEWLPLQTGIRVSGGGAAVLICSPDVPLFCVGDIVRGRWPKEMDLTGGHLFSYVLNNYWHTNYPAAQNGRLTFSYELSSAVEIGPAEASRLGWQLRRPLYAQRLSFQDFRTPRSPYLDPAGGQLASVGSEEVVLSTLKRARYADGWIARLREIGGRDRVAPISFPGKRVQQAWRIDLLEEEIDELPVEVDGSLRVPVPAWGLATVRFTLSSTTRDGRPS